MNHTNFRIGEVLLEKKKPKDDSVEMFEIPSYACTKITLSLLFHPVLILICTEIRVPSQETVTDDSWVLYGGGQRTNVLDTLQTMVGSFLLQLNSKWSALTRIVFCYTSIGVGVPAASENLLVYLMHVPCKTFLILQNSSRLNLYYAEF